ncbi:hypothetical protein RHGRI_002466 [Rhododendron griersonianum]|uniref:Uncharacterized protein n=1 Tax=Rhododendron griersonianum TaxID=479676 RepID=A0AAV6I2G0_9ERIC|nr:hypothetical protein RHGRI_033472 [Rhododendron griersonianum]KAG5521238.1 hypothetical protein RHGRI_033707 [Rhododendron griersonianum]KAG5531129.1 hypothetical protein RHGRI_025921 [Rhododendron griersonianum]KAG5550277.1 hypothetical protein RHGRI_015289 [Rhododendron griersonianum]KAG5565324.1 hypothetical protein RHGRI_001276 [Rhododendron griersonianum]
MPSLNDLTASISMYPIAELTPNITAPNSLTGILAPPPPPPSLESRRGVVVVGTVEEEEERGCCFREIRDGDERGNVGTWEMEMNQVKWEEMNVGDGDDVDKRADGWTCKLENVRCRE